MPALRSIGLSVSRIGVPGDDTKRNSAGELVRSIDRGDALNTAIVANNATLDAEDVVHGFRFDVWDSVTQKWHALAARTGSYEFPTISRSIPVATDGGFVTHGPTSAADGSSTDFWFQQSLVHWKGWSLAAPRPGATIFQDQVIPQPQPALRPELPDAARCSASRARSPGCASACSITSAPTPSTWPRTASTSAPRASYSPAPSCSMPPCPSVPLSYGRFEPVPSPPLWFHSPKTVGESMERVVLRSNFNAAPVPATAERHVVPPVTSVHLAEEHGAFDTAPGGPPDPSAYRRHRGPGTFTPGTRTPT